MGDNTPADAFTERYASDHWSGGSGVGSRKELNDEYRSIVQAMVRAADINSVVDAGCGDWQFSRAVDWSPVSYRGFDVVQPVVENNRRQFARPGVQFDVLDIANQPLPRADLLLCKDMLQHWPVDAVRRFLDTNLGQFRYALITNDVTSVHCEPEKCNTDIQFGEWRTLDLEQPPFSMSGWGHVDLDYLGEWTKRVTLFCSGRRAFVGRMRRSSGLHAFQTAVNAVQTQ